MKWWFNRPQKEWWNKLFWFSYLFTITIGTDDSLFSSLSSIRVDCGFWFDRFQCKQNITKKLRSGFDVFRSFVGWSWLHRRWSLLFVLCNLLWLEEIDKTVALLFSWSNFLTSLIFQKRKNFPKSIQPKRKKW